MGKSILKTTSDKYEAMLASCEKYNKLAQQVNKDLRICMLDRPGNWIAYNEKDCIDGKITKYRTGSSLKKLYNSFN